MPVLTRKDAQHLGQSAAARVAADELARAAMQMQRALAPWSQRVERCSCPECSARRRLRDATAAYLRTE